MTLKLHIHSNIWSDNIEIMCPPKLMKEFVKLIEKFPEVEISLFESAIKPLLEKSK